MSQTPFEEMPFEELLARARAREPRARDELFRRSEKRVKQWVGTRPVEIGRDRPSEIPQNILEGAVKGFDSFKGNTAGEWYCWLETLFENKGKQADRDGSRQKRAPRGMASFDEEGAPEPVSCEKSMSQHLVRKQEYELLYAAVFRLSKDQGRAIYLRYFKDMDRGEVAVQMKKEKSTISNLIARGLTRLAKQMPHLDPAQKDDAEPPAPGDVETALLAYLRGQEAGEEFDTEAWLARHPACAKELRGILSTIEELHTHAPHPRKKK